MPTSPPSAAALRPLPRGGLRLDLAVQAAGLAAAMALGWYLGGAGDPRLAALGLAAAAGGGIVLSRPLLGLAGIVVVIAANVSDNLITYFGAPSLAKFLLPGALVLLGYRWLARGEALLVDPRALGLFGAFGALILIGVPTATDWQVALTGFTEFLKDAGIALLVVAFFTRAEALRTVFAALLATAIGVCTLALYKYGVAGDLTNDYYGFARSMYDSGRLAGPLTDPNFFGALLVILLPIALHGLVFGQGFAHRVLCAYAAGAIVTCILLTQSRGALLAMFAMGGLALLLFDRRTALRLALVFALAGAVAGAVLSDALVARFGSLLALGGDLGTLQDASIQGRLAQWVVAIAQFSDHPLLGVGSGNYNVNFQDYSLNLGLKFRNGQERSAHSIYLEVLAEMGIVGFLGFLALLGAAAAGVVRAMAIARAAGRADLRYRYATLGIALGGYFCAMVFLHDAYARMMWMMLALAIALPRIAGVELGSGTGPGTGPGTGVRA